MAKAKSNKIYPSITKAMGKGEVGEVKRLLELHPEYQTRDPECRWILSNAIVLQDQAMISMLVEMGFNINSIVSLGSSPLGVAITNDSVELVKFLLSLGADPSYDSANQMLPVNASVGSKKNTLAILKLLRDHGCDLNQVFTGNNDDTPMNALSMAMTYGKADVVKWLKSIGCTLPEGLAETT